jgi:hypothetical protein
LSEDVKYSFDRVMDEACLARAVGGFCKHGR